MQRLKMWFVQQGAVIAMAVVVVVALGAVLINRTSSAEASTSNPATAKTIATVALVDQVPVSEQELALAANGQAISRGQVLDDYLTRAVLAAKYTEDDPESKARIAFATRSILSEAWMTKQTRLIDSQVTDKQIEDWYKANVTDGQFRKYKISYYLTQRREDAGNPSADKFARVKAGDEEWLTLAQMPYGAGPLVARMKKGERTTEPLFMRDGWLLLRVDDIAEGTKPSLPTVTPDIRRILVSNRLGDDIRAMRSAADIRLK